MQDIYAPTQLVRVVNAEDIQKQLKTLFTDLFFTRSVTFEAAGESPKKVKRPYPLIALVSRLNVNCYGNHK